MAARVFSQQLDRSKPLWELWLVAGPRASDRFALITKTHHALVDGVSGVDIATVLFDVKPVPEPAEPEHDWVPSPEPSGAELAARGRRGRREAPIGARPPGRVGGPPPRGARRAGDPRRPRASARSPGTSPTRRPTCRSTRRSARTGASPGSARELADFKQIKDALGGTVNDVVLAVVSRRAAAAGCSAAACAPRASSCGRWSRSRSAPRTSTASSATRSPRCAARCRSTSRTRCARLRRCREAMDGAQGVEAGARRRGDLALQRLRPADAARPGVADQLLDPPLQPDRHQRPGPADPALRARARAPGRLPGRVPAREPRAGDRDHDLQRRHRLRPARRLRLDGGPRRDRRGHRDRDRAGCSRRRTNRRSGRRRRGRRGIRKPSASSDQATNASA